MLQVLSALWMYGRLPLGAAPEWIGGAHRISGRLAFLLSLPVAYHCLYQLAFQHSSTRVLVHSLVGCAFYGAFATKVMIVRSHGLPGIALPVAGGVLFTAPDRRVADERAAGSSPRTASPLPDVLRRLDRFLAPVVWVAAALTVFLLLAGPSLIGAKADKPAATGPAAAAAARRQGDLHLQLRQLPHARARGHERQRRPEPRRR